MAYELIEHHRRHLIVDTSGALAQFAPGWLSAVAYYEALAAGGLPAGPRSGDSARSTFLAGMLAGMAMASAAGIVVMPPAKLGISEYTAIAPGVIQQARTPRR